MSEPYVPPTPPPPPPGSVPPPPAGGPGTVSQNRNLMIVLSYLWLWLIPLLTEKEDREVLWHAKHGAVLTVAEILVYIVVGILSNLPFLGWMGCALFSVLPLLFLVVAILAIMKGINGQRLIIPGLSEFADRF